MRQSSKPRRRAGGPACLASVLGGVWLFFPVLLRGQSDFANTDAGRPFRTQDAQVIERGALELHLPTVQWARSNDVTRWRFEPELALGVLPRTQLDIGVDVAAGARAADSVESDHVILRVVHQLNVESLQFPAFAVGLQSAVPLNSADVDWQGVLVATRTFGAVRVHANARGRLGPQAGVGTSRWELGVAADRTMPMRHLLVGAEVVAVRPDIPRGQSVWRAGVGARWQWSVRTALDAGVSRTSGGDGEWQVTAGISTSTSLRFLLGGMR